MNHVTMEHLCKCQSAILSIPVKLYLEHTLVQSFDSFSGVFNIDLIQPYLNQLFETDELVNYIITADMLVIGLIKNKSSPYSIIIGPICIGGVSDKMVRKIITSEIYDLKLDDFSKLSSYLNKHKIVTFEYFLILISTLFTSINHDIIQPQDIIKYDTEYNIESEVEKNMLAQDEKTSFHGLQRRSSHSFEADLLFYIKHGMTSQLKALEGRNLMTQTGTLAPDALRHYKNALIILNTLSSRAAMSGGLSPETCYQLGEIYIQRIESCTDMKYLGVLSRTIRIDYCERVRELKYPHTDDLVINKAMHYINENIHKKLLVSDIADMLHISKEYLSSRFKKVTNTSLPDYINQEKVLEAKRLLQLTSKPLAEISEYLAFSSQSYFQTIFKKLEGITPLEYRNAPQDGII